MQITDIQLTVFQISGNQEGTGILISQRPAYEYSDGKKTGNQIGITYEVVFPDNLFEKASVKVAGTQPAITEEQLKKNSGKIKVKFKNLTGRFYRANSGEYALSCRAEGLEVIP